MLGHDWNGLRRKEGGGRVPKSEEREEAQRERERKKITFRMFKQRCKLLGETTTTKNLFGVYTKHW